MHILIEPQSVTDRASAIVLDNSSLAKRSLAKGNSKRGLHTFIHTYLLTPRVQDTPVMELDDDGQRNGRWALPDPPNRAPPPSGLHSLLG